MVRGLVLAAVVVGVVTGLSGCKSSSSDDGGSATRQPAGQPGQPGVLPPGQGGIILEPPRNPDTSSPGTGPAVNPTAQGGCYKAPDQLTCDTELAILRKVNELRAGKSPMTYDPKMAFVARQWSQTQGQRGNIGHSGFPNQREQAYKAEFGSLDVSMDAENVAMSMMGSANAEELASEIFNMWKSSPGHRMNMMGNYPLIGIGVYLKGEDVYATQIFGGRG